MAKLRTKANRYNQSPTLSCAVITSESAKGGTSLIGLLRATQSGKQYTWKCPSALRHLKIDDARAIAKKVHTLHSVVPILTASIPLQRKWRKLHCRVPQAALATRRYDRHPQAHVRGLGRARLCHHRTAATLPTCSTKSK